MNGVSREDIEADLTARFTAVGVAMAGRGDVVAAMGPMSASGDFIGLDGRRYRPWDGTWICVQSQDIADAELAAHERLRRTR